jgi:hypothetical protein
MRIPPDKEQNVDTLFSAVLQKLEIVVAESGFKEVSLFANDIDT